jgi:hypothetical protein
LAVELLVESSSEVELELQVDFQLMEIVMVENLSAQPDSHLAVPH